KEYIRNFPYDEYDNETDYQSWNKESSLYSKTDSVRETKSFTIHHSPFTPGWYVIEISTKDKNGEEVKDVKYILLVDEKNNQLASPQYLWAQGSKQIEPGEQTELKIGTSADNLFVVQEIDKSNESRLNSPDYKFESLNNEKRSFSFTATE